MPVMHPAIPRFASPNRGLTGAESGRFARRKSTGPDPVDDAMMLIALPSIHPLGRGDDRQKSGEGENDFQVLHGVFLYGKGRIDRSPVQYFRTYF
jgi:hypothetical protein